MTPPVPLSWVALLRVVIAWVDWESCFGIVSSVDGVEAALGRPGPLLVMHSLCTLG